MAEKTWEGFDRRKKHYTRPPVIDPDSFDSPESSTVVHAEYDKETRKMRVNFKHGTDYFFDDMDPELWHDFVLARSKGSFFSSRIRPFFHGRKVL